MPKSYIQIVDCVLSPKNEYVVKRSEIVDEITTVLDEWGDLFKKFFLTNHEIFQPIRRKILELIRLRSQILSGNLPVDEMKEVKLMATSEIDTGNKLLGKLILHCIYMNTCQIYWRIVYYHRVSSSLLDLCHLTAAASGNFFLSISGLDMVVRDESGNILDGNGTSTTQLYEHHTHAIDRIRKATVSLI